MNSYIVQKGDTLYGIAREHDTSVQRIKELNNLSNDNIYVGQKLIIMDDSDTQPYECVVYTVKKGDSLYSIAKKYETTVDELKRYNNLKSNLIDVGDRIIIPCDYNIGTNDNFTYYIVEKGDNLYSIAKKFGTTIDKIISDNNLKSSVLSIGTTLLVDDNNMINTIEECYGSSEPINNNYVVQSGDSLYSIAKKYNTSVNEIMNLNNLNSTLLSIGQELIIPNNDSKNDIYVVQSGDSLYSIAKKYNTSVDSLKNKNNLNSNLISIGQKLYI